MKPRTAHLARHFLQEDIYLLPADRAYYIDRPPLPAPAEETPAPVFNYMGSYKKQVLLLSYYPEQEHISEAHLKALTSTLQRIGLAAEDVALLNIATHPGYSYELLTIHLNPVKLVILGAEALPADAPPLTMHQLQDVAGVRTLYTFGFGEMMGNKDKTKLFWNQIKEI